MTIMFSVKLTTSLILVPAIFFGQVSAFWRMPCSRSGFARIDPLVSPGQIAAHAHTIHGSSAFGPSSGSADLRAGSCTSCQVVQDKSAYWTPPPYFHDYATGQFQAAEQIGGMLAYYLLYPNSGSNSITAFPDGFRMIAGKNLQRNFTLPVPDPPKSDWAALGQDTQAHREAKATGFNCLNYQNVAATEGSLFRHFLPNKAFIEANCPDGIRFELMFPSCWNGVDIYKEDNSHVAYPSLVMSGDCPPSHPTRLPSLFYETIWQFSAFRGKDGEFVIANADDLGYGYHGDYIMGWDPGFLQQAVDTCTNLSGRIEDCPIFTIQDASIYNNCNITVPPEIASENIFGPMPTLPGDLFIQRGPGLAIDGLTNAQVNGTAPQTPSQNPPPPPENIPPPPQNNPPPPAPTPVVPPPPPPVVPDPSVMTTPSTPDPATPQENPPVVSTQWVTQDNGATVEILYVDEVVTIDAPPANNAPAKRSPQSARAPGAGHAAHAARHVKRLRSGHHHAL